MDRSSQMGSASISFSTSNHGSISTIEVEGVECIACGNEWRNFSYICYPCNFDMDIICATAMERKIDHPSHKHPLTPVRRTALLLCDACGQKHEGTWYQCTTCVHFWIHRDCASLPSTIERSDHKHPLTLSYTLPSQYTTFDVFCDICREELRHYYWVYYCGKCRYFTHVRCAPSKIEPLMSIHPPEIDDHDSDRLYLPPDDIKSINSYLQSCNTHFTQTTGSSSSQNPLNRWACFDVKVVVFIATGLPSVVRAASSTSTSHVVPYQARLTMKLIGITSSISRQTYPVRASHVVTA
ncbi:hypothetical protein RJ639_009468 [Escallonia herrerae]|uniref:DC1 domain-containing protein n=1 Tax=Escallonia herrerae TaxID=1293975 RepID=A0AA88VQV1_9ASTE|nr:hypothetical protein RJ639_009468 [Escallonia herrerae]